MLDPAAVLLLYAAPRGNDTIAIEGQHIQIRATQSGPHAAVKDSPRSHRAF
jgi:hypothetical protein